MPDKGTRKVTAAQRKRVAEGIVNNETSRETAAATGLAPGTVRNVRMDARTRSILEYCTEKNQDKLVALYDSAVDRLGYVMSDPNPDVGLRAIGRMTNLLRAVTPPMPRLEPVGDTDQGDFTFEELMTSMVKIETIARKK